ncbi:hypothetical protein, partial [Anaplasma marginale]|uniref:hypothetical protein n=1 Tax=Anaplasma marginale TaxID=770 RepID=UPI0019D6C14C
SKTAPLQLQKTKWYRAHVWRHLELSTATGGHGHFWARDSRTASYLAAGILLNPKNSWVGI